MRISPFNYYAAESLPAALQYLEEHGEETRPLAGGTDLVLAMKERKIRPRRILALHKLSELQELTISDGKMRIGALCRHAELASHPVLKSRAPLLCAAAGSIGSWQIRNIATLGGNLCTASPAADSAPALLALQAQAVIVEQGATHQMPLADFFRGPRQSALTARQLLKEIVFELPSESAWGCYVKQMRKHAVDLATVSVACQAERAPGSGKLLAVRLALGGVAPTPIRATEAEALLNGLTTDEARRALPDAARAAVRASRPISDIRASAEYRRTLLDVSVRRAVQQTLEHLESI